jgi:WD40 repeat protein
LNNTTTTYSNNNKKSTPASCKSLSFSLDGSTIFTGGSAGDLCAVDAERACSFSVQPDKQLMWRIEPAATGDKYNPLVAIHPLGSNTDDNTNNKNALFATGDDAGGVRIWDPRLCGNWSSSSTSSSNKSKRSPGCVMSWEEHEDYISGFDHSQDGNTLLATSADCRLGVFDLRMPKGPTKNVRLSDDQEDELLSIKIIKHGKKVVCGTGEGVLNVWSWGTWGDVSDRFPGHPNSIDALLKIDENTLLTGSSDGVIRVVQIQPDKLLGLLGDDHDGGFPIEKLDFNSNRNTVGSLSHNNFIRLWDARILMDDDCSDDSKESNHDNERSSDEEEVKAPARPIKTNPGTKQTSDDNSDDEWDDMDKKSSDEDDSDDNDSDSDDSKEPDTVNDARKKRLKTENEKFFDDL